MTYPNGRVLDYVYGSGLDTTISRLTSLSSNSTTLESLSYLGLGTVVKRAHPEPGVDLTYIKQGAESNGDAGDQYTGLDRFGRVVDQRWIKTSDGSHTDRFKYGYDRDSNRLYRENVVNAAFSELYHTNGASNGYDNLNQLVEFRRGTLSDTNSDNIPDTVSTSSRYQVWTMDGQGNWSSLNTDGSSVSRTHNKQNQVTAVGAASLTFDSNGNLTTDEIGQQYNFDAWNRLVTVKNSGGTTIASYKYDALTHRIQQTVSATTTDFYFSSDWQVLEEQISGTTKIQYVWSPVYVDALVERDRDADGNGANGLEERFYVQQDANFNVTAIINTSGTVTERYVYDPYGAPTFLSAGWTGPADGYSWRILHQGGKFESVTGLNNFGYRDELPSLGRWIQLDPLGFGAGDPNLYRYVANSPVNGTDPSGLQIRERDGRNERRRYEDDLRLRMAFLERQIRDVIDDTIRRRLERELRRLGSDLAYSVEGGNPSLLTPGQAGDWIDPIELLAGLGPGRVGVGSATGPAIGRGGANAIVEGGVREAEAAAAQAARALAVRSLRDRLLERAVDPRLRDAINNLYRRGARVGDGSSMAALRFERLTGILLSESGHAFKLLARRKQLMKVLRDRSVCPSDRAIAREILADIQDALNVIRR